LKSTFTNNSNIVIETT